MLEKHKLSAKSQQSISTILLQSGIIDQTGNIDQHLAKEKKSWPVALRSLLKLQTSGKIKMMVSNKKYCV